MSKPEPPVIQRATSELAALALAVRPDWRERDVSGAIAAAALDGQSWPRVLTALPRLMADPSASPRDLVPDSRSPLARRRGTGRVGEHAAAARAGLGKGGTEGSGT